MSNWIKSNKTIVVVFVVIALLICVWNIAKAEANQTHELDQTRFMLTYDGLEVTNAAILDLGHDGFMIFIQYDGKLPTLKLEDGKSIPITNSYDIMKLNDY